MLFSKISDRPPWDSICRLPLILAETSIRLHKQIWLISPEKGHHHHPTIIFTDVNLLRSPFSRPTVALRAKYCDTESHLGRDGSYRVKKIIITTWLSSSTFCEAHFPDQQWLCRRHTPTHFLLCCISSTSFYGTSIEVAFQAHHSMAHHFTVHFYIESCINWSYMCKLNHIEVTSFDRTFLYCKLHIEHIF